MPNYLNSKIYKLVDNTTGNIYIGSTTRTLYQRKAEHESDYRLYLKVKSNYVTSYEIMKNGDFNIVLIENFPCDDKSQLNYRESQHILKNECVNKVIPGRAIRQWKEDSKKREENKEKAAKYREKYKNRRNEHHDCECGSWYTLHNKGRHLKSTEHQKYLQLFQ